MNRQNWSKQLLCLGLALFLLLTLAACKGQADEQDSTPPTATVTPTETPEPEPTAPIPYTDVPTDAEYYDAVVWAYQNGIASDGETFGPADVCTRGQMISFLWRAMGSPEPWIMENPFDDASPDDWYYKPALWAYQHNIAASTTVNPGNPCTSAEALTFLWRAEGTPDKLNTMAASGTYYGQPVAWADKNGLLSGAEFDPDAPCTRAGLMAYLYWAVEQWTPSEEDQRLQTEYEKIIYDPSNIYRWACVDYVDVDGNGNAALLTLRRINGDEVAVEVYADMDGHVQKTCEETFFTYDGDDFFTCRADGQLYLCHNVTSGTLGETYDYYKIESGAITFCGQATLMYRESSPESDIAMVEKYTLEKDLFRISYHEGVKVLDKGILPSREESERYWTAYWEASDPVYAAVLSGDFSAFAGNYVGGDYNPPYWEYHEEVSATINKDGTGTGDYLHAESILYMIVREDGTIYAATDREYDGEVLMYEWGYVIYPAGYAAGYIDSLGIEDDLSKTRIYYGLGGSGSFAFLTKTS